MKISELIEPINRKLPTKLSNYKITVEKMFDVYKLNDTKNVIRYTTILESDLVKFNPSFIYYLEQQTNVYLYAHHTNKIGEVNKILLGTFEVVNEKLIFLKIHSNKYKSLIKVIKKALGVKPTMGKTTYTISLRNDFEIEKTERYSIPKKVEQYTYEFSDNTIKVLAKEKCYIASDISITTGIKIKNIHMKNSYEFEYNFEHKHLL